MNVNGSRYIMDTKEKLQKDYDDIEKGKKDKKARISTLRTEVLQLEAEQMELQVRWNNLK